MNIIGKIAAVAGVSAMIITTGCTTVPTADSMYSTASTIGSTAALVVEQMNIEDSVKNAVIDIVKQVQTYTPATNETISVVWNETAEQYVKKLTDEGKVTEQQANLILTAFKVVAKGIDYVVYTKYPAVAEDIVLVESATHGFCDGFLSYFGSTKSAGFAAKKTKIDKEAYEYLKNL